MRLKINSERTLEEAIEAISSEFRQHKYITVSIMYGKGRTLPLNALSHAWYTKVAKEEKQHTEGEIKCLCKYHFGLPILRGEDEEFNDACERCIDLLPYENKIAAMEYMPVTSLMNTNQFIRYMEAIQKNFFGRVKLEFPDEKEEVGKR